MKPPTGADGGNVRSLRDRHADVGGLSQTTISVTAKRGSGPRHARSTQRWEGEYFRPPNVVGNERRLREGLDRGGLVWRSLSKCSQAARDAQG